MINFNGNNFIYNSNIIAIMFENITPILYLFTGFVVTYLGLEIAWHFTACRIHDKAIKPCMFKQLETLILVLRQ
jgi:hypothetical protein